MLVFNNSLSLELYVDVLYFHICAFLCFSFNIYSLVTALIETLSEDRASVMQEKKHLEEELNRLRSTGLVSPAFFPSNTSAQEVTEAGAAARALLVAGACYSEPMAETERLASVATIRDDEHVDSAVEASMVTVQ